MKTKSLSRTGLVLLWLVGAFACRQAEAPTNILNSDVARDAAMINPGGHIKHDEDNSDTIDKNRMVWMCKSRGSKRYHLKKDCGRLKQCKHTVEQQSKKEAEAIGLTLCKSEI